MFSHPSAKLQGMARGLTRMKRIDADFLLPGVRKTGSRTMGKFQCPVPEFIAPRHENCTAVQFFSKAFGFFFHGRAIFVARPCDFSFLLQPLFSHPLFRVPAPQGKKKSASIRPIRGNPRSIPRRGLSAFRILS